MGLDELNKRWDRHVAQHRVVDQMAFVDGFLVLGAGTRLAKVGAPVAKTHSTGIGEEAGRQGDPRPRSPRRERVAKLRDPKEDARRLFLADALMSDALTTDLAQHCARHLPNGDDRHSRRGGAPGRPFLPKT
jgi:hypothetical protein